MKKNNSGSPALAFLLSIIGVFVLVRFGMSLGGGSSSSVNAASTTGVGVSATRNGNVQRATIGFSNRTFNYEPSVIRLKRGVPAEITLDIATLKNTGCMAVVISRQLGLQFTATEGENIARFTPERAGTFAFACPMGMGRGTFVVEG